MFPGLWINNYPGASSVFFVPNSADAWTHALLWGKPIVSSRLEIRGFINHNVQLYRECGPFPIKSGIFIAHLTRLNPLQRIEANLRKLKSLGLIAEDIGLE